MSNKEHKDLIKDIKSYTEKLLNSKVEAKKFLVSAGIHTQTGRLARAYNNAETALVIKVNK